VAVPLPQPGRRNLWLAFGHQHVGFSTGTAKLLGALMSGQPAPIDAHPFRAERSLSRPAPNRTAAGRAAPEALPERPIRESSENCRSQQLSNKKTPRKEAFFARQILLSYPA
jgi:hypothetical protein